MNDFPPAVIEFMKQLNRTHQRGANQSSQIGDTQLTPEQEAQFISQWKPQNAPRDSGYDYDNRGAFLADTQGKLPPPDARGHGTDQFKKPWHPTYSAGSNIPSPPGMVPGRWGKTPEGRAMFTPGSANMQFHSPEELNAYFQQVEPNMFLNLNRLPPSFVYGVRK